MERKNRASNILWGVAFILIGIGFAGKAFDMWNFNLFFDGWWSLFIIIPCAIGIISNGPRSSNITGLIIGLLLLLIAQDVIRWSTIGNLIVPLILVIIGLGFIFRNNAHHHETMEFNDFVETGANNPDPNFTTNTGSQDAGQGKSQGGYKDISAIFSGRKVTYQNETFTGATINSIFGGSELDLRNAYMNGHIDIVVTSIFGGTTIYVPDNVRVETSGVPIFGGIDNKAPNPIGDVRAVLHINATCMFGGIEIK
ncbi:MAG: LiaF-related protein [bacterium]|nr:LiaF-related protein [bacterium]